MRNRIDSVSGLAVTGDKSGTGVGKVERVQFREKYLELGGIWELVKRPSALVTSLDLRR